MQPQEDSDPSERTVLRRPLSWLALCTLYNESASQLVAMQRDPHSFEKRRGASDLFPLWGSPLVTSSPSPLALPGDAHSGVNLGYALAEPSTAQLQPRPRASPAQPAP